MSDIDLGGLVAPTSESDQNEEPTLEELEAKVAELKAAAAADVVAALNARKAALEQRGWEFAGYEDPTDKANGSLLATLGGAVHFASNTLSGLLWFVEGWQQSQAAKKREFRHPLYRGE